MMLVGRILLVSFLVFGIIATLFVAITERNGWELGKAAIQVVGLVTYYECLIESKGVKI